MTAHGPLRCTGVYSSLVPRLPSLFAAEKVGKPGDEATGVVHGAVRFTSYHCKNTLHCFVNRTSATCVQLTLYTL